MDNFDTRYYSEIDLPAQWLDTDIAEWDTIEHLYVPTLDFIRRRTGIDLDLEEEGRGEIHALRAARLIKQIMDGKAIDDNDKDVNEYFLTRDSDKGLAFVLATISLIEADDINGVISLFYEPGLELNVSREDLNMALEVPAVMRQIDSGELVKHNWISKVKNYRVGY